MTWAMGWWFAPNARLCAQGGREAWPLSPASLPGRQRQGAVPGLHCQLPPISWQLRPLGPTRRWGPERVRNRPWLSLQPLALQLMMNTAGGGAAVAGLAAGLERSVCGACRPSVLSRPSAPSASGAASPLAAWGGDVDAESGRDGGSEREGAVELGVELRVAPDAGAEPAAGVSACGPRWPAASLATAMPACAAKPSSSAAAIVQLRILSVLCRVCTAPLPTCPAPAGLACFLPLV